MFDLKTLFKTYNISDDEIAFIDQALTLCTLKTRYLSPLSFSSVNVFPDWLISFACGLLGGLRHGVLPQDRLMEIFILTPMRKGWETTDFSTFFVEEEHQMENIFQKVTGRCFYSGKPPNALQRLKDRLCSK